MSSSAMRMADILESTAAPLEIAIATGDTEKIRQIFEQLPETLRRYARIMRLVEASNDDLQNTLERAYRSMCMYSDALNRAGDALNKYQQHQFTQLMVLKSKSGMLN
jgi:Na+/phosphate symporter